MSSKLVSACSLITASLFTLSSRSKLGPSPREPLPFAVVATRCCLSAAISRSYSSTSAWRRSYAALSPCLTGSLIKCAVYLCCSCLVRASSYALRTSCSLFFCVDCKLLRYKIVLYGLRCYCFCDVYSPIAPIIGRLPSMTNENTMLPQKNDYREGCALVVESNFVDVNRSKHRMFRIKNDGVSLTPLQAMPNIRRKTPSWKLRG